MSLLEVPLQIYNACQKPTVFFQQSTFEFLKSIQSIDGLNSTKSVACVYALLTFEYSVELNGRQDLFSHAQRQTL